jgi:broad specificity phosphatase PhoE
MSYSYTARPDTELILVRHGTTDDNLASRWTGWRDTPLNEAGRLQAKLVAAYLAANYMVVSMFTSPLQRALTTARIIGARMGLEPQVCDGLKESHFGEVEGMPDAEVRERYASTYAAALDLNDLDFGWPAGETRREFVARIRQTMDEVIKAGAGGRTLLVGHGGMISLFLADVLEGDPCRWPKYMVSNCSISHLAMSSAGPRLLSLNEIGHLASGPAELLAQAQAAPPLWKMPTEMERG